MYLNANPMASLVLGTTMRISRVLIAFTILVCVLAGSACRGAARRDIFGVVPADGHWMIPKPNNYERIALQRLKQAGVTSVRMGIGWPEAMPERGKYAWDELDKEVDLWRSHGIEIYALIVNTPPWASPTGKNEHGYAPKPECLPDFEEFCYQIGKRYRGKIRYYEIWNEQNGYGWHTDKGFNQVEEYIPVLKAAYAGLKRGDPDCLVGLGGLDDAGGNAHIFLEKMYDLRANVFFDAVATHPYGETDGAKVKRLHDIMAANGDGHKPLWLTEYGWDVPPTREARQSAAQNLKAYLDTLSKPEFDYVTAAHYIGIGDFEQRVSGFGLCDINLRPKEAFYVFQAYPKSPGDLTISRVRISDISTTKATVSFELNRPAKAAVIVQTLVKAGRPIRVALPTGGPKRTALVTGLNPGTGYSVTVLAETADGRKARQEGYAFHTVGTRLLNPDFEAGFDAGLPRVWLNRGNAIWVGLPKSAKASDVHRGEWALAVVNPGKGVLDDTAYQRVAARKGARLVFAAWTKGHSADPQKADVFRKVGIDPTGGLDPASPNVVWSAPENNDDTWTRQEISAKARSGFVTVFVRGESQGDGAWRIFTVDDASLEQR